jgi:hypothetical protein
LRYQEGVVLGLPMGWWIGERIRIGDLHMISHETRIVVISETVREGESVLVDCVSYFRGQVKQVTHDFCLV